MRGASISPGEMTMIAYPCVIFCFSHTWQCIALLNFIQSFLVKSAMETLADKIILSLHAKFFNSWANHAIVIATKPILRQRVIVRAMNIVHYTKNLMIHVTMFTYLPFPSFSECIPGQHIRQMRRVPFCSSCWNLITCCPGQLDRAVVKFSTVCCVKIWL